MPIGGVEGYNPAALPTQGLDRQGPPGNADADQEIGGRESEAATAAPETPAEGNADREPDQESQRRGAQLDVVA